MKKILFTIVFILFTCQISFASENMIEMRQKMTNGVPTITHGEFNRDNERFINVSIPGRGDFTGVETLRGGISIDWNNPRSTPQPSHPTHQEKREENNRKN